MDARIGQLSSGKFYAYAAGYAADPVIGSLPEVEDALGLPRSQEAEAAPAKPACTAHKVFNVVLRFQFPAWDELEGIQYQGIEADSKAQANEQARRMARRDGHLCGGKGRATFAATLADE